MKATLRKPLVYALMGLAVSCFLFVIAVDPYFYYTRPLQPRGNATYPSRIKAISVVADVYLTRTDVRLRNNIVWIHCTYGVLFFAAAVLNLHWKVIPNPYDDMPKKFY